MSMIPETNKVLIYPFKCLMIYEDKIRKALANAEQECLSMMTKSAGKKCHQAERRL
jgi:hypothetical protein